MKKIISIQFLIWISISISFGQQERMDVAEIYHELNKLEETTTVLYLAAHPDDENTRLIAYLANDRKFRTGYLALTRGDGGQNLIGDEQSAYLGVIRTNELLAARNIDGGQQFFTRAIDFGYSKSPDEALRIWNHDSVLADVVWVIRNFRPDVIITRFPPDSRGGHGHHTASALLAREAYEAAADPRRFKEQFRYVEPWQVKCVAWNSSYWWDNSLPDQLDNKTLFRVDAGAYDPVLGTSYGEIAGEARSQHRSQGFGAAPYRGEQWEYLKILAGEMPSEDSEWLQVESKWTRWDLAEAEEQIKKVIEQFNFLEPSASVPALLEILKELETVNDIPEIDYKKAQLKNILSAMLGLWIEPVANNNSYTQGDTMMLKHEVLLGTNLPLKIESIQIGNLLSSSGELIQQNQFYLDTTYLPMLELNNSTPFWLKRPYSATYDIPDQTLRGLPLVDELPVVTYNFILNGYQFSIDKQIVYKYTDPANGEIYTPIVVLPPLVISINQQTSIFKPGEPSEVLVDVEALKEISGVDVKLDVPELWSVEPSSFSIDLILKGERNQVSFLVKPSNDEACDCGPITPVAIYDGNKYDKKLTVIDYPHIPYQQILEHAAKRAVLLNMTIPDKRIGYIEGAGDLVDESLIAAGMDVTLIDPEVIVDIDLSEYDVVITGVRAFNVSDELNNNVTKLQEYVYSGGTLIVQYNTRSRGNSGGQSFSDKNANGTGLGPYPFEISRERTTDEAAMPKFNIPEHAILNTPNKISDEDFEGWVQERGLYYVGDADERYEFPLAFKDPDEDYSNGSIMTLEYGEGNLIYTGLSFFRQLPAGVPGAYKLMFNMIGQ